MPDPMLTLLFPESDVYLIMAALRSYAKECGTSEEGRDALLIEMLLGAHLACRRAARERQG